MSHQLACYLVKQGVLTAEQVEQAQASANDPMESPMAVMIRSREIDDVGLARWLATRFALPLVNLARVKIDDRARERIPEGLLETTPCLPIGVDGDTTIVAISDPMVINEVRDAWKAVNGQVEIVLTTFTALWAAYRAEMTESSFWEALRDINEKTEEVTVTVTFTELTAA